MFIGTMIYIGLALRNSVMDSVPISNIPITTTVAEIGALLYEHFARHHSGSCLPHVTPQRWVLVPFAVSIVREFDAPRHRFAGAWNRIPVDRMQVFDLADGGRL